MFKGFPQPWRGWLLALTALIFALVVVQFFTRGWVIAVVVLALIAIQVALTYYARRQF